MRFPEKAAGDRRRPGSAAQPRRKPSGRSWPIRLFWRELQKHHNVRVYTFDTGLASPPAVVLPAQAERTAARHPADLTAKASPKRRTRSENGRVGGRLDRLKGSVDWNEILRPRGLETRLGESVIQAVQQLGGRTLSGIVVISDGDSNAGIEPSTAQDVAKAANARLLRSASAARSRRSICRWPASRPPPTSTSAILTSFRPSSRATEWRERRPPSNCLSRPEGDEKTQPKVIETPRGSRAGRRRSDRSPFSSDADGRRRR